MMNAATIRSTAKIIHFVYLLDTIAISVLDLPASCCDQLYKRYCRDKYCEQHCLCLSDSFEADTRIEGVEDVQSQHFCLVVRSTVCECQVLIVKFEAVCQRQEHADRDAWHYGRNDDLEQRCPAVCSVNGSRFQHVAGDVLDCSNVDDHHVSDVLPVHEDDKAPEAVFGIGEQCLLEVCKNAVEDNLPDPAEDDASDEVRHEENCPERVCSGHILCKYQCQGEGQDVDGYHSDDCEAQREPEGLCEIVVNRESPDVVVQSDKACIRDCPELAEGEDEAPDHRNEEGKRKTNQRGQGKESKIFSECLFHSCEP